MVAVVAAMTCCLPIVPLALAATSATAGAVLTPLRPWFLVLAVALIGYAFVEARRAERCNRQAGRAAKILLWTSAAIVIVVILAPDLLANLLAG